MAVSCVCQSQLARSYLTAVEVSMAWLQLKNSQKSLETFLSFHERLEHPPPSFELLRVSPNNEITISVSIDIVSISIQSAFV